MNVVWRELHLATDVFSKEPPNDYGRQCLTCQKRGKKCDSTPVVCLRCQKDKIECSGYATAVNKAYLRRSGAHQNAWSNVTSSNLQLVPSMSQDTKDWVALLESVKYYNSKVVPHSKPAHLPYRRKLIDTKYWNLIPTILRCLWIVNVGSMQACRGGTDPLCNNNIVQYRGRSLVELQQLMKDVPEAVNDSYGVALYSILFLMGAEMQISSPQWSSHMEAARRIIGLKGGLGTCFERFPPITHVPLMSFLMADTITATTCPARLLTPAFVQTQRESLNVLPSIEEELIATGYSYPLPLLLVIIRTNMLRGQMHGNNSMNRHRKPFDYDFSTLLQSVQTFDAERWASRVSKFGRALPEVANTAISISSMICLASLARCYKSATMLYVVLSTSPSLAFIDSQLRQTVHASRHTLEQDLSLLFEQGQNAGGPGCDGPLHTQLWKFVVWPLFVSVYVRAAWGLSVSAVDPQDYLTNAMDLEDAMDRDMKHLLSVSTAMGTKKHVYLEKLVARVKHARVRAASTDIQTTLAWDDAFSERSVFAV